MLWLPVAGGGVARARAWQGVATPCAETRTVRLSSRIRSSRRFVAASRSSWSYTGCTARTSAVRSASLAATIAPPPLQYTLAASASVTRWSSTQRWVAEAASFNTLLVVGASSLNTLELMTSEFTLVVKVTLPVAMAGACRDSARTNAVSEPPTLPAWMASTPT